MPSAATAPPATEFNDFLFASIGEDSNGMPVSVLSGLARLDMDPWQEAAQLAQSPRETATQRLASLIGALRERESAYPDPPTIATAAAAAGRIQQSIVQHAERRWSDSHLQALVDICDPDVLCVGYAIFHGKPETTGNG
jgi:hypothetical protein